MRTGLGKKVATQFNQVQTPGYHAVNWDADNLPSGVYLIRMDSGDFTQTQKVVLVKDSQANHIITYYIY